MAKRGLNYKELVPASREPGDGDLHFLHHHHPQEMVFGSSNVARPGTRKNPWSPRWEPTPHEEMQGKIYLQAITAMPQYATCSFEEHRLADLFYEDPYSSRLVRSSSPVTLPPQPVRPPILDFLAKDERGPVASPPILPTAEHWVPGQTSTRFSAAVSKPSGWNSVAFKGWDQVSTAYDFHTPGIRYQDFFNTGHRNPFFQ